MKEFNIDAVILFNVEKLVIVGYMEVNGFDINEVYNIMPINNINKVLQHGILCYNKAISLHPESIASFEIQQLRSIKSVPNGHALHEYANLYFDARNPMMFKHRRRNDICVLRISEDVFNLNDVVLSDRNAASDYATYYTVEDINKLDFNLIFARDWTCPGDPIGYYKRKKVKCAEILVKDRVPQNLIVGAYVKNDLIKINLENQGFNREILINEDIFFG